MPSAFLNGLVDLAMSPNGDLVISSGGDIALANGPQAVISNILFRLQTVQGDWQLEPACGASLEQFVGALNTSDTGQAVQSAVIAALTHDNFIAPSDLDVRVSPLNVNEVVVYVQVPVLGQPVTFVGALNLREGQLRTA
jgi:hypothetical protein